MIFIIIFFELNNNVFFFLGNTWETMPRNVAINSLATWMIEHPCIENTNYQRTSVESTSTSCNVLSRVSNKCFGNSNLFF